SKFRYHKISMGKKNKTAKKNSWSTDRIISSSAFFISVVSLIALLYQSYLAREENKLIQKQQSATVMPYLTQWFDDSEGNHKMVVGNDGVGPAFVKDFNIIINENQNFSNTDDLLQELAKTNKFLDTVNYLYSTLTIGTLIPANETVEIISFDNSAAFKTFRTILYRNKFDFEITYEDVYGAQWKLRYDEDVPKKITE
ncbi:MAG: hypothetical protein AAF348_15770, partial [Bacteroidota bacterium]